MGELTIKRLIEINERSSRELRSLENRIVTVECHVGSGAFMNVTGRLRLDEDGVWSVTSTDTPSHAEFSPEQVERTITVRPEGDNSYPYIQLKTAL